MDKPIELTSYELWYLLSLEAPSTIIGFRNPMVGMLTEDMLPLVQEASLSLFDRGLIEATPDSYMRARADIETLISVLADPQHSVLCGHRLIGSPRESVKSLHLEGKRVVLLEELPNESYSLGKLASRDDALATITAPFVEKVYWAPDSEHLELERDALLEIQAFVLAGELPKAQTRLDEAGGTAECKAQFLEALQRPDMSFSVVAFMDRQRTGRAETTGFAAITDEHHIWMIDAGDERANSASVSKVTLRRLKEMLESILPNME